MCGLAGVWAPSWDPLRRTDLTEAMLARLRHRGTDDRHTLSTASSTLGATRLSIVDLAAGRQPMASDDGQVIVAQNGEIYNHAELRAQLTAAGQVFRSTCDTEVLLRGYLAWGWPTLLKRLRGMFAVAVVDEGQRCVHLARDPFGIKPLYLAPLDDGRAWAFASELRALLAPGLVPLRLRPEAVSQLLLRGWVPGRAPLVESVERMPPGHEVTLGQGTPRPFWQPPTAPRPQTGTIDDAVDALDAVLSDSVHWHLGGDVPVGLLLSGGVDSSLIAALAARQGCKRSFGLEVGGAGGAAAATAAALDLQHVAVVLTEDDCLAALDEVLAAVDEPLGDPRQIPSWLLARAAGREMRVVLAGHGADVLFGGYALYAAPSMSARWIAPPELVARLNPGGGGGRVDEDLLPVAHREAQFKDLSSWQPDSLLLQFDRTTMIHGVEGRTPFVDIEVAAYALGLPHNLLYRDSQGKWLLRRLAERLLPAGVAARPRTPWRLPLDDWLRGPLYQRCRAAFADEASDSQCGLDGTLLLRLLEAHRDGTAGLAPVLWTAYGLLDWQHRQAARD